MSRLHVLESEPRVVARWQAAQLATVAGFVALVVTLAAAPTVALRSLWAVAVPLLPATFFVSPALWRGICPLSTLNAWGNHLGSPRAPAPGEAQALGVAGLVLFHALVPARHLGLNTSGPLLAGTLVAIALVAVGAGMRWESRSGFCNALCPVLPIERLYGQAALVAIKRGRCARCAVCTPTGCIDLAEQKALRQVVGPPRRGNGWLATPFGVFAAALPGFILGYAAVRDGGWPDAGRTYLATLGGSALSFATVAALTRLARPAPLRALAVLAAVSGGLYCWITAPLIAAAFGFPAGVTAALRSAALLLMSAWLVRALHPRRAAA